jgi:hypothetical protein
MADTRCQLECEDWVRQEWMPVHYGQRFRRERVRLSSGGMFDFDAVSDDNTIVATVSTSSALTGSGKNGGGKLNKLRSDMLFLLLASPQRSLMILTEKDMYELCLREREAGRVPQTIEFVHSPLPSQLAERLVMAKKKSSDEVSPVKSNARLTSRSDDVNGDER